MIYKIQSKEDETGKKFPFIDVGSETHGRTSFRLWVSGKLVTKNEDGNLMLAFPVRNARIIKTAKGSLVLKPDDTQTVHDIYMPCGYRGGSDIEVISPTNVEQFEYEIYSSSRGSLGVSHGKMVNTPAGSVLKYKWHRTGRLYGSPSCGVCIRTEDGIEREFDMLPDGLEAMEELPAMEEEKV